MDIHGINKNINSLGMEIILFIEKGPEERVLHWCNFRVVEYHPIHIGCEQLIGVHR